MAKTPAWQNNVRKFRGCVRMGTCSDSTPTSSAISETCLRRIAQSVSMTSLSRITMCIASGKTALFGTGRIAKHVGCLGAEKIGQGQFIVRCLLQAYKHVNAVARKNHLKTFTQTGVLLTAQKNTEQAAKLVFCKKQNKSSLKHTESNLPNVQPAQKILSRPSLTTRHNVSSIWGLTSILGICCGYMTSRLDAALSLECQ